MQHAGRGDRHLRPCASSRPSGTRTSGAGYRRRAIATWRRSSASAAASSARLYRRACSPADANWTSRLHDALDRRQEISRPGLTTEVAVGDPLQAGLFLHRDGHLDQTVLDPRQRWSLDLALGVLLARDLEFGRTQKRSDLIGAKRGMVFEKGGHDWSFRLRFTMATTCQTMGDGRCPRNAAGADRDYLASVAMPALATICFMRCNSAVNLA